MHQSIVLSWEQIWGVIGGFFAIFAVFYKLIDKKFDKIDEKFDKIDKMFDKQDTDMKEFKKESHAKFDQLTQAIASFDKHAEHRLTKMEMEVKNTNQRLLTIENFLIPKKVYQFATSEPPHPEKQEKENYQ